MGLYVGTSGWAYREWKPVFYPQDLPQARFLEHYATRLSACEINATYYSRQKQETLDRWAGSVPEGFRFATKAHRAITPRNPGSEIAQEFIAGVKTLGQRLGAVLFQFGIKRDGNEDDLLRLLDGVGGVPRAVDLKHASWDEDAAELVARTGATLCFTDLQGTPPAALPPGDIAYVRLRAPGYAAKDRKAWVSLLRDEASARDVFVFCKHEDAPAGDEKAGVGLAEWLKDNAAP